ncbi:putative small secreted protein [Oikeobacillus pervagus]|uniref:Small secreted protein n=1 Tax=Oikeobacillus pervagus TaxID=1325931 RepID=A0AAJ1T4I5_9BACI|nr:PepSY domain-containing protein [Oikeobacillus pervagus]MDQ0215739.1 putative small secreted protein [Oikeobacillus pervagus]
MKYNWKTFLAGAVSGAIGALAVQQAISNQMSVSAEKILENVKEAFKKDGAIDGSWIQMKPEEFHKLGLQTTVYRGGISRRVNEKLEQFEFIADAKTGTIMDVYRLP